MKDDLRSKCETNDYGRPHQGCLALEPLDWWSHANECRKHANMFQCCNSWKHLLPTSLSTSTLFYQSTSARSLLTTALTHTPLLHSFKSWRARALSRPWSHSRTPTWPSWYFMATKSQRAFHESMTLGLSQKPNLNSLNKPFQAGRSPDKLSCFCHLQH